MCKKPFLTSRGYLHVHVFSRSTDPWRVIFLDNGLNYISDTALVVLLVSTHLSGEDVLHKKVVNKCLVHANMERILMNNGRLLGRCEPNCVLDWRGDFSL